MGLESVGDLLRRARAGSPEALDALYQRCASRLLAFIRLRMGRELRAKMESRDVLQSTFVKSLTHFQDVKAPNTGSLMAWLAKIAEHEIRDRADYYHRQRRQANHEVQIEDASVLPASTRSALSRLILGEEAERLEVAIESLSPDYREIILLRKFEELSFAEIAAKTGRSEDACRMLLARAMAALTLKMSEVPR